MTTPESVNRRPFFVACGLGVALLVVGTGTAALANAAPSAKPDVVAIEEFCTLEQQGIHQLAEDLRRRKREVESREHALDAQKAEMATAEGRLRDRLAELERIRTEVQGLLGVGDAKRTERVAGLVKMIEANRAASIAGMFAELDEVLAVEVLDLMNRTKAGRLLAALPPELAARLAERMTAPIVVELP